MRDLCVEGHEISKLDEVIGQGWLEETFCGNPAGTLFVRTFITIDFDHMDHELINST